MAEKKKGSMLLDFLSQMIAKPETMQQMQKPMQPTGMLGQGLAQGSANLMQLHPVWAQQFADGTTQLQFPEWVKQQGIANPVLPPQQIAVDQQ